MVKFKFENDIRDTKNIHGTTLKKGMMQLQNT